MDVTLTTKITLRKTKDKIYNFKLVYFEKSYNVKYYSKKPGRK